MIALLLPAAWLLLLCAIAAPFEVSERGRRFVARVVERWG